jgi:hypothetical protein
MGRIGRNNIQQNFTIRFRDDLQIMKLFTNETDLAIALNKILSNKYNPREWFVRNKGYKNSGAIFATFLVKNFPNINNKDVRYIDIT